MVARFIIESLLSQELFMTQPAQHTFNVTGMTCGHCEKAVVQAVRELDPTADVKADRTANRVDVTSGTAPRGAGCRHPRRRLRRCLIQWLPT
jgi:copper chaperone